MESGTGILSLGSHKSLKPPSDGRPAWRNPPVQGEFNARPSEIFPASDFSVLEEKESPCGLKEHDYIGLAENSAFEQSPPVELEKDSELSLGGEDLRLELGLGLGTTSTRKSDHEKYADFLLKQKDAGKSQKGGNSKAPVETSRHGFPEVAATLLQKPWQNGMPGTADCLTSSNRTIRDYQIPKKITTFVHDHDEGPSRASLSPFYGPNVKNGMKRGYTEAMHDVTRYDIASAVPVVGRVAEGEAKALPKHQQNGYMSKFLPPKPPKVSAHRVVGPEKLATHAFVPRNEKMTRENAILPLNPPENCKEPATNDPPPPKGQVVGWPPIRSYRKQNLAKPTEMFVKVNMDGMTVGRKVDLNAHSSYEALYKALEDMFQASNNGGQGTFQSVQGRESLVHDAKQIRLLDGSEYVLTYEDQDGDWMMVGDVPWGMFVNMVRRLRITRKSEATGLAPTRRPEINK